MKPEETKRALTDPELAQVEGGVGRKNGRPWLLSNPQTDTQTGLEDLLGTTASSSTTIATEKAEL